jgi:hypothetical protein
LIDAVQVIYNIFDQNPEDELFPVCRELNVAVIARVPFDEGTLTGTLTLDSKWPEGDWRNTYFVPEKSEGQRRAGRGPAHSNSVRDDNAGHGTAFHPCLPRCQHDHPRYEENQTRAVQHRPQRCRAARSSIDRPTAPASLGAQTHALVAVVLAQDIIGALHPKFELAYEQGRHRLASVRLMPYTRRLSQ